MVVAVTGGNVEGHAFEEFKQVLLRVLGIGPVLDELRQLQVAAALALFFAQQGHGRGVKAPLVALPVKPLNAKCAVGPAELKELCIGHIQPGLVCHLVGEVLPGGDVAIVIARGEFAHPQAAILRGEVRFGASAAQ